jgi:hypothetical protein
VPLEGLDLRGGLEGGLRRECLLEALREGPLVIVVQDAPNLGQVLVDHLL